MRTKKYRVLKGPRAGELVEQVADLAGGKKVRVRFGFTTAIFSLGGNGAEREIRLVLDVLRADLEEVT